MQDWLANFSVKKFSIFVITIVSFTYNVLLERDVLCSCDDVGLDCVVYMAVPSVIIFFLMIWINKSCLRACTFDCTCCKRSTGAPKCTFCGTIVCHIFKAALVGVLWVVSVLIDGDWYVCCQYNHYIGTKNNSKLACMDKNNLTADDKLGIAHLKNISRNIGFVVLLGIFVTVTLMSAFDWKKLCNRGRRQIYYQMVLEQDEEVLKTTLRESAKKELTEKIKNKISQDNWEECFDTATDMIESSRNPTIAELNPRRTCSIF